MISDKKLKIYILISWFIIGIGLVMVLSNLPDDSSGNYQEKNSNTVPVLILLSGVIFFTITKLRLWLNRD